jgi:cytochrome c oxidase subunit II
MALALALVVTGLTLVCVYLFSAHTWWFPAATSTIGRQVDHQFDLTLLLCGAIFVLAQLGLAWFVWKYRDRPGRQPRYYHGNGKLESLWTAITALLFIGLTFLGYHLWAQMHFTGPAPGAMRVEVWGEQFAFYFRYPGPDGQFGPVHPELMDDAAGNYLGLDRARDAAARDDMVTATLEVPVNQPVELILRSKDVTHGFFVRELRLKQDLVPGMEIPVHFTPTRVGRYEIVCTQLCGLGHYKMRAFLQVATEEDFEHWMARMAQAQ